MMSWYHDLLAWYHKDSLTWIINMILAWYHDDYLTWIVNMIQAWYYDDYITWIINMILAWYHTNYKHDPGMMSWYHDSVHMALLNRYLLMPDQICIVSISYNIQAPGSKGSKRHCAVVDSDSDVELQLFMTLDHGYNYLHKVLIYSWDEYLGNAMP